MFAIRRFYFIFFHYVIRIHYCNLTASETPLEYWIWITWLRSGWSDCGIDNVLRYIHLATSKNRAIRSTPEITFGYFTKLTRIFWIILPGSDHVFVWSVDCRVLNVELIANCCRREEFDHGAVMETFHQQHGNGFRNKFLFLLSIARLPWKGTIHAVYPFLSPYFINNIYFNHIQRWWAKPTQYLFLFDATENLKCSRTFFPYVIWPCLRGEQVDASAALFGPNKTELLSLFFLFYFCQHGNKRDTTILVSALFDAIFMRSKWQRQYLSVAKVVLYENNKKKQEEKI